MVFEALELLRSELEAYLKPLADPITVRLGNIATVAGTQANAVLITLVNLEEESTLKNTSAYQRNASGGFDLQNPPVFLNLYVLISANHAHIDDYESALKMLSWIIQCYQKKNQYTLANTPAATALNDGGPGASPIDPGVMLLQIVVDFYSLSFERLNQLWGTLGGKQVPAVMYKIRVVVEQAGGQLGAGPTIRGIEGRMKQTPGTPD